MNAVREQANINTDAFIKEVGDKYRECAKTSLTYIQKLGSFQRENHKSLTEANFNTEKVDALLRLQNRIRATRKVDY